MKKVGEKVDAYCQKCGAKLVVSQITSIGFSTVTGKERFHISVACPNKKWTDDFFSMFIQINHSKGTLYGIKYHLVSLW